MQELMNRDICMSRSCNFQSVFAIDFEAIFPKLCCARKRGRIEEKRKRERERETEARIDFTKHSSTLFSLGENRSRMVADIDEPFTKEIVSIVGRW